MDEHRLRHHVAAHQHPHLLQCHCQWRQDGEATLREGRAQGRNGAARVPDGGHQGAHLQALYPARHTILSGARRQRRSRQEGRQWWQTLQGERQDRYGAVQRERFLRKPQVYGQLLRLLPQRRPQVQLHRLHQEAGIACIGWRSVRTGLQRNIAVYHVARLDAQRYSGSRHELSLCSRSDEGQQASGRSHHGGDGTLETSA